MPFFTAPIPRPPCICTALYYNDDCPQHGRMFRTWQSRRAPEEDMTLAPTLAPTPASVYPMVKLWLWFERVMAGRTK